MKSRRKLIFIILLIMFLIASLLLIQDGSKKYSNIYNVAVVLNRKNNEDLSVIKAGIDQASLDMNVNIRIISLIENNDEEEQIENIKKEIDEDVDALIISPADSDKLAHIIEEVNKNIPVILIGSKINSKVELPYISCDNYELGRSLGEEIIKNGNTRNKIYIIKNNNNLINMKERFNGIIDELKNSKNTYEIIEMPEKEEDLYSMLINLMNNKEKNIIISLEIDSLEAIGKVKKNILENTDVKSDISIYGIGRTSNIISFVEKDIINSIAIQNEFNVGYLSVKIAVSEIEDIKIDSNMKIESTIINRRNMYSEENQKILFPIVR